MTDLPATRQRRLNGIAPPVGTLLPGIEPLVVDSVDNPEALFLPTANLRTATNADFIAATTRKPPEVHSVYEHTLIRRRFSVFGIIAEMGD